MASIKWLHTRTLIHLTGQRNASHICSKVGFDSSGCSIKMRSNRTVTTACCSSQTPACRTRTCCSSTPPPPRSGPGRTRSPTDPRPPGLATASPRCCRGGTRRQRRATRRRTAGDLTGFNLLLVLRTSSLSCPLPFFVIICSHPWPPDLFIHSSL